MWKCHKLIGLLMILMFLQWYEVSAQSAYKSNKKLQSLLSKLNNQVQLYSDSSTYLLPLLNQIETINPTDYNLLILKSNIYHTRQQYKLAEPYYQKLFRYYPSQINGKYRFRMLQNFRVMNRSQSYENQLMCWLAQNYNSDSAMYYENELHQWEKLNKNSSLDLDSQQFNNEILKLNNANDQANLSVSMFGNTMVLSEKDQSGEKFLYKNYDGKLWDSLANLPFLNYYDGSESAATLNHNGRYIFYTKCNSRAWDGYSGGGCDIYYSVYNDSSWSVPQKFGEAINTPAFEGHAFLSPDENTLFFSSNRPGGYGGKDIYYSIFNRGYWDIPVNAGPQINTAGDDYSPYIAQDNRTFLYASNGRSENHNFDIYQSTWNAYTFDTATKLGFPYNTDHNEFAACLIPNKNEIVLSSNRSDSAKSRDFDLYIFNFQMPNYDQLPGQIINGQILYSLDLKAYHSVNNLIDKNNNTLVENKSNNAGNGWFFWMLHKYDNPSQLMTYSLDELIKTNVTFPVNYLDCNPIVNWTILMNPYK